jgi:hypothetical protein
MGNLFKNENDAAAQVAGLLFVRQDEDEPDQFGIYPMTVRVPAPLAALVTVMAEHAGISRNEMVKLLLKAGVADSLDRVPPELAAEVHEEAQSRIEDFI